MTFAIAGEGITDFTIIKHILIRYFNNNDLEVRKLRPEHKEPFGWSNLLNYIDSETFKGAFDYNDYVIIQIDTAECQDWKLELTSYNDKKEKIEDFISRVISKLVIKIGEDFYNKNKNAILFAICVNEIECWLLPFNSQLRNITKKTTGCYNAMKPIAIKKGFSIDQKNYDDGKNYEKLIKPATNKKVLIEKAKLNPSLNHFIESLNITFNSLEVI
jgi:hypothetical protein